MRALCFVYVLTERRGFSDSVFEKGKISLNKKDKFKLIIALLVNCAVFDGVYLYLVSLNRYKLTYGVMITYISLFLICIFTYVIYNKGILGFKTITPDMVASTLTYEKRVEYAEDMNRRKKRSVYLLTLALPLLLAFLLDYLDVGNLLNDIWKLF